MANDLNQCNFTGNLGRDPEVKYSAAGMAIVNFSIAVSGRKKVGEQWEDTTEWVPLVCFGRTAENVGKYLVKGSKIRATGRFSTSSWEKDGERRYKSEILVSDLQMLGGSSNDQRNNSSQNNNQAQNYQQSAAGNQANNQSAGAFEDFDGIPFNQLPSKVYF